VIAFPYSQWKGGVLDLQLSAFINEALQLILEQVNYLNTEMFGTQDSPIQIRPHHWVLHHVWAFLTETS